MILKYDVMLCGKERERGQREGAERGGRYDMFSV